MTVFNYTSTDKTIVAAAQAFIDMKKQVVSTAEAFCEKNNVGAPGFERSMISGSYRFASVRMKRDEWNKKHRKDWSCPSSDWSTPRRPGKGKKPSQLYTDWREAIEVEAEAQPLYEAIGLNCGLSQPGFFLHDGALYMEHGSSIENPAMTEITQSVMQQAKEATKEPK